MKISDERLECLSLFSFREKYIYCYGNIMHNSRRMMNMILFMILLLMIVLLTVFTVVVVGATGAVGIVLFGDVIVCIFILVLLFKKIFMRK